MTNTTAITTTDTESALGQIEMIQNALKWLNDSAQQEASEQTVQERYLAITDAWMGIVEIANALMAHHSAVKELTQQKAELMTRLAISQSNNLALRENAMNEARKQFVEAIAISLDLSPNSAGVFLDVVTGRESAISAFMLNDLQRRAEDTVDDVLWTKSETDTEGWGEDWEGEGEDELG